MYKNRIRIVALLTIRNEEIYLERCLKHLLSQDIEVCIIDNESSDASRNIAERFLGKGVCHIETLPFSGQFELVAQCRHQERLSLEIDADWFIHHDADEIREAPPPYRTLREGIEAADAAGYNAINFDEFVFVPTSTIECHEGTDYVEQMRYYYYFSPAPLHRVNAWKKTTDINLSRSGGHNAEFDSRRIMPRNFILRHYIFLSADHAQKKYMRRIYSQEEIEQRAWHGWRSVFHKVRFALPSIKQLKLTQEDGIWDTSSPESAHLFLLGDSDV